MQRDWKVVFDPAVKTLIREVYGEGGVAAFEALVDQVELDGTGKRRYFSTIEEVGGLSKLKRRGKGGKEFDFKSPKYTTPRMVVERSSSNVLLFIGFWMPTHHAMYCQFLDVARAQHNQEVKDHPHEFVDDDDKSMWNVCDGQRGRAKIGWTAEQPWKRVALKVRSDVVAVAAAAVPSNQPASVAAVAATSDMSMLNENWVQGMKNLSKK
jgi:hypothetical protein